MLPLLSRRFSDLSRFLQVGYIENFAKLLKSFFPLDFLEKYIKDKRKNVVFFCCNILP